ncbi:hypothetical protein [Teichococcus aestuarii]|uniref:Uncharacterized protein n=1 Tax=Teichococcus aestuarii TaxID=568898 RepID=A0A2U1UZ68_9PROT|nr:hypothetical protein [Pseudoroseomonas aestuarii]PWC26954.1 hypothetical protein CR165_20510 [Pseudoroseomonas aestuarii]
MGLPPPENYLVTQQTSVRTVTGSTAPLEPGHVVVMRDDFAENINYIGHISISAVYGEVKRLVASGHMRRMK